MEWINENPIYNEIPIREFRGNPLIEALPLPPENPEEAIRRLMKKPLFEASERDLPSQYRVFFPSRLYHCVFPTLQHVKLLGQIYGQILNGYRGRNPLTPAGQQLLHGFREHGPLYNTEGQNKFRIQSPVANVPANISFLTGLSGMGKTTLMRSILKSLGKPVIKHSIYKEIPFPETQIIYLSRNVPDQCSAKSVCKSFSDRVDELVGRDFYAKLFSDKSMTRTHYVSVLRKIVATHHVGVVVIDEAQNISLAKSGGKNEFLALILNLREELGIPIILVGTYRAAALLKNEASIARRLVEGGFNELKRPASSSDNEWIATCKAIWKYQWVQNPQALSDEAIDVLYDCSQGITGIMINVFVTAQTSAIGEGKETITPSIIREIYNECFRPLHFMIDILRRNEPDELAQYDDLYFDVMSRPDPIQSHLALVGAQMEQKKEELMQHHEIDNKKHRKKTAEPQNNRKNKLPLGVLYNKIRETTPAAFPEGGD